MLNVFIRLKVWQVVVLVLIVCGIVGGFYAAYGQSSGSSASSSLSASTKLAQVEYGNLTSTVSASGSLAFANPDDLTFGSAGTVQEVNVAVGDSVKQGDVLAELDNTTILSLQASVTSANITLRNAQETLQNVQTQGLADAQRAVTEAQQQLANAQTQGPLNIANAQYAANTASQNYTDSLEKFVEGRITAGQLENVKVQLDTANLNLEIAQQNADKAVADAQDNLTTAQQDLANTGTGSLDLELDRQQVNSAQAALNQAEEKLGNATLVAPFDGIVSKVNVDAGQTVSADAVAIEIVNPSEVEVSTTVDEIDVPKVKVGQKATISLDALPDDEFSGVVSTISPVGSSQSGVVSYPVTIELTVPSGMQLRQGMSATATITNRLATNVLLIPVKAVSNSSTNPRVTVMVNGVPEVRQVKLGQSDGTSTEVLSGLNAGDEVVVTSTSTSSSTSSSSSRGGFGGMGGLGGLGGGAFVR